MFDVVIKSEYTACEQKCLRNIHKKPACHIRDSEDLIRDKDYRRYNQQQRTCVLEYGIKVTHQGRCSTPTPPAMAARMYEAICNMSLTVLFIANENIKAGDRPRATPCRVI